MMSYDQWLNCILEAVKNLSSPEFQEEAWFPGGKVMSSPDEIYLGLMEDCTVDLFFETYVGNFTHDQVEVWKRLRSQLEGYYDKLPGNPDRRQILNDPEWDEVRKSAKHFLEAFRPGPNVTLTSKA